MKILACEEVGQARGSVHVVAGLARAFAARGRAVRRPATGGTTRRAFSKNGRHCSFISVNPNEPNSVT